MKILYITIVFFSATGIYSAQESKMTEPSQEVPAKFTVQKDPVSEKYQKKSENQPVSEYGLTTDVRGGASKNTGAEGKVYDGKTSEIELIRATIPGGKTVPSPPEQKPPAVKGLPAPASLEEIKSTIPKN